MKVQDLTVKGYEFAGYVTVEDVEMNIYGYFSVDWDYGKPIVVVDKVCLAGGEELVLKHSLDGRDLEEQIQNCGDEMAWYQDKLDYYRDEDYA